ncbi:MAG: DUF4215 domain-containing protein [bacterium]
MCLFLAGAVSGGGCAKGVDPCGNGEVDHGEECDGDNHGGATCESLGRGAGTLTCNDECLLETLGCVGGPCGNGILDLGETCDGSNMGGRTCVTEFFNGGDLRCGANCQVDTSGCTDELCGNGLLNPGEECDDGDLDDGDGCDAGCAVEDGWSCDQQPSVCVRNCGNAAIEFGEDCDGANLNGASCVTLGYDAGPLACSAQCRYDTTLCQGAPPCGNGVIEGTEQCDGGNLGGATCVSLGYTSGILTCRTDCSYDTSLCATESCGNGTIDSGEQCDLGNLGGATCVSLGFLSGSLSCTAGCVYNTSSCVAATCGNGNIDAGEQCDGANLNSQTCLTRGYTGGTLACAANCTFNEGGCTSGGTCGDGTLNAGEGCDDGNTTSGDGCSGSCQWENQCTADSTVACNGQVSGNIGLFRFDDNINYMTSCSTNAATGPEDIFSFVPTNSGLATVHLDVDHDTFLFGDDMDLYILEGGCNQQLCVDFSDDAGDDTVNFSVTGGRTYYVVVEHDKYGFPPVGDYTVNVSCP